MKGNWKKKNNNNNKFRLKTAFCTKYAQYSREFVNRYRAALGQHIKRTVQRISPLY